MKFKTKFSLKNFAQKISSLFKKHILKNKKSLAIFIVACVLIIGIAGFLLYKFVFSEKKAQTTTQATVTRGSIENVIEGTGTVEAKAQYEVKYLSSVDVLEDFFEEGDYVEKDQILYQMDAEDIERNIKRQQSNVEKAQINYADALESFNNLNVKTDVDGVITNLYVKKGDNVSNGTKIADVINKDILVVTLPFGATDAKNIYVGQSAEVTLMDSLTTLYGRVTNVGSGTYVNSYRVEVTDVEIEVANPAAILEGETVTAVIGDYACYDSSVLEYLVSKTIVSKTSGEVKNIIKKKGDALKSGNTIVTLESKNSSRTVSEARMSLEDALSSLEQLLESREDAAIKSKIAGKVIQKNIKAGEILDSGTSSTMAVIADLSSLKFDISIDELDISKISVGQEVSITADALSGQHFTGKVSNVSIVGTAYQGVTSYPVTITIENTEGSDLIPGMNVEAKIVIESADNVLRVPVSALRMGNLVIVKDDGTFADPLEMNIDFASFVSPNQTKEDTKKQQSPTQTKVDETKKDEQPVAPAGEINPKDFKNGNFGGKTPNGKNNIITEEKAKETTNTPKQTSETSQSNTNTMPKMDESKKKEMQEEQKKRLKSMIDNLDVPDGYTVVRVVTGLNDGSFVEIKEIEGSLKEGDIVLVPVVVNTNTNQSYGAMGGGMPAGMGGGMPGGMSGGMPGGMGGGMPGGMGSRTSGGASGFNRQGSRKR